MNNDNTYISSNKKMFYSKFGDKEYSFSLALYNVTPDDITAIQPNVVYLQKNALMQLSITDSVFNPFHTATLIISNDNQFLEKNKIPYTFLGNGRDIVDIEIISITSGDFDKDISDEQNKKFLGMHFHFVVIECEDVIYNQATCKKLELVEFAQYQLSENICNIFGLQAPKTGISNYLDTNGSNSMSTTEMIKQIIKTVYDVGEEDLLYRDLNTGELVFDGDGESILNINPYGLISYAEIMNYVLSFHSYQKSPCILNYDRYSKKFALISISRLFKENTKRLVETLYFPTQASSQKMNPSIKWDYNLSFTFEESKIDGFYVDSPTCKYNVINSSNAGILSNSRGFKSMIFDLTTLNSDTFSKQFIELFIDPFKKIFGEQYTLLPNYYLSPNKKNNFTTHKGNLPPLLDERKFLNSKLQSLLYLNNVYKFKLKGRISRQALSFVDVIKNAEEESNTIEPTTWDYNTLGRHLIVNTNHVFTQNDYFNEIETIKPYRLADPNKLGTTSLNEYLSYYKDKF